MKKEWVNPELNQLGIINSFGAYSDGISNGPTTS